MWNVTFVLTNAQQQEYAVNERITKIKQTPHHLPPAIICCLQSFSTTKKSQCKWSLFICSAALAILPVCLCIDYTWGIKLHFILLLVSSPLPLFYHLFYYFTITFTIRYSFSRRAPQSIVHAIVLITSHLVGYGKYIIPFFSSSYSSDYGDQW